MHHNNLTKNGRDRGPCGGIKTGRTKRFGISADSRLLENFDTLINHKGYVNRSEAIRDIIRDQLVEFASTMDNEEMVGTITLVYSHESRELSDKLIDLQHQNHAHIVSSLHVHLDGHNCL
ncbi:MAG: nickel-responsive transcriptional regulator NikR, partial [Deltaproteobacteria bacterium]|nr:nickel-responsive transcriptional regulator NikR [Deltaproteobacteria bacterium]